MGWQDAPEVDAPAAAPPPAAPKAPRWQSAPDVSQQSLRESMSGAVRVNPDQFAEARKLETTTGIPAPVAARNLDEVRSRAQLEGYDKLLTQAPVLAQHLTDKPDFAKVSHDDTDALAQLEGHLKDFGTTLANAPGEIAKGFAGGFNKLGEGANLVGAGLVRLLLAARAPGADQRAVLDPIFKNMVDPLVQNEQAFAPGGGLKNQAPAGAPGLGDQIFNAFGSAGSALVEAILTGGEAPAARAGASATEALTQAIEHGTKSMSIPAVTSAVDRGRSVYETTNDPVAAVRAALAQYEATTLQGILPVSAPGAPAARVAQGAVSGLVGGEVAKQVSDAGLPPELVQPMTLDERIVNLVTGGVLAVGGPGKAQAGLRSAEAVQQLGEMAKTSKLAQRDPAAFQAFVDEAAAHGPVQDVFVSGKLLAETLAQSGTPLEEFARQAPVAGAQVGEALASGGDVRIPLGEYATAIAPSDAGAALLPHLKTDPNGMSQAEAQAYLQSHADEVKATTEKVLADKKGTDAFAESAAKVEASVLEQLTSANRFTKDVNRAYALLTRDFYSTLAARHGTTPEEMAKRFPLKITAEPIAGETLQQSPVAARYAELVALGDKATPEQKAERAALENSGAALPKVNPDQVVNDMLGLKGKKPFMLFQGRANRGAFDPATNTVALLKDADLSTFIHESGHFYLETLANLAGQADSPVAGDMQKVLDWFGVKDLATWQGMTLEQRRASHEKFARGFEAYLFEGKAPSVELKGVFARVRAWLLNVYRSLASLNVELTPEVRGVFDRLLASEQQIREAEAAAGARPLFKSAAEADMTPDQWAAYQALGAEATQNAVDDLQRRSVRDMQWLSNARSRALRELQREADAKRIEVEREVRAEVRRQPVYAARRFMSHGELPEGFARTGTQRDAVIESGLKGTKLSLEALREMYGDGPAAPWRYLPTGKNGLATATDGLHPDTVAELFGFSSGDELVRKILDAQPEDQVIEGMTDQRMLERHGELATPDALARAANEAVHNDARMRFVATELNALAKATGGRKVLASAAKEFAEQIVARKRVRDLKPAQYTAAEARAARAAEAAVKAGNLPEAAVEKRNQLVNGYASRAAAEAVAEVEKGLRYLKKFAGPTGVDPDYAEQIHALLARFDLRRLTDREGERRASLADWVKAQQDLGFEPAIDESLLNEAARKPYRELSVEEFRGLVDTVRNIAHLGYLKNRLLKAAGERELAAAVEEAVGSIEANAKGVKPVKIENNSKLDRVAEGAGEFFAMHRKIASLLREMDGFKDGGVMWDLIMRPLNEASTAEAVAREKATVALDKLFTPEIVKGMRQKLYIPEIGASLSKEGRLAVALNWGNVEGRQRITDGDGWNPAQVQAILSTLTRGELEFVQKVWDFNESFWPEIAAKERRVTGVVPQKVKAAPYQVRSVDGHTVSLEGGYYRIKYDPNRSSKAESHNLAEAARQTMLGAFTRATTRRGFTKKRAEEVSGRPVRKDLGVLFENTGEVLHDLHFHEYLIDANRLLRAKGIDAAIRQHYGPEVLRQLKNAMTDVAAGDIPAANVFERSVNHIRTGATIAGLGWNITTALLQPIGLTQSMVRIGPKWVGRGLSRWMRDAGSMESSAAWIYERSDFMRLRGKTMQREIAEIRNRVGGDHGAISDSFFYLIGQMQKVADIPTWLGAYEKAMEGMRDAGAVDEKRAAALADQAVLDAQGGGQIKDLAGIQRGGPLMKLWTNFYSFFNVTYNLAVERAKATRLKNPAALGRLAVDYLLLFTVPAALSVALRSALRPGSDDKGFLEKLGREHLNYLFGSMVGLRELGSAINGFSGYTGPAGLRFFSEISNLYHQAGQGEVDAALLKALNNVGGILFHYPAGQVQRTVQGVAALVEGDTQNPAALVTGAPQK